MSTNPKEAELRWLEAQRGGKPPLAYPTDMPPIHFKIVETESKFPKFDISAIPGIIDDIYNNGIPKRKLDHIQTYRLPLPTPLADQTGIEFDANFSWGTLASKALGGIGDSVAGSIPAAIGYTPNQHKTVVLAQPNFKQHSFEWKLAPRNPTESKLIQQILHGLRKGMTPETVKIGSINALFVFPHIFLLSFSPTPQYLYKFKPCVLRDMTVDYNGGNPVPVFYGENVVRDDPAALVSPATTAKPESIRVRLEFLEIEYWIREDLAKNEVDGLPSHDPYPFKDYVFDDVAPTDPGAA